MDDSGGGGVTVVGVYDRVGQGWMTQHHTLGKNEGGEILDRWGGVTGSRLSNTPMKAVS